SVTASQVQNGTVTGQLHFPDGRPAEGVRVAAMAAPASSSPSNEVNVLLGITETDRSGRYKLVDIPSGRYYIVAGLVGLPTYYPGSQASSGAVGVTVRPGDTV